MEPERHDTKPLDFWDRVHSALVLLGFTVLVGFGVSSWWCFGLGFPLMVIGSRGVLHRTARDAGFQPQTHGWVAGIYALVLASVLCLADLFLLFMLEDSGMEGVAPFYWTVVGTLLVGAGLAPFALAPFASAAGERGWLAPWVRAIDLAGSDRMLPLAGLCAVIAVGLIVPIPLVTRGLGAAVSSWDIGAPPDPTHLPVGWAALGVWLLAVPVSAMVLMRRYRRLVTRARSESRIGAAVRPVLAAFLLGLLCLAAASAVAGMTPSDELAAGFGAQLVGRVGPVVQGILALVACLFVGAVWGFGRAGARLRFMAAPPFELSGRVLSADDRAVVFQPDEGRTVRIPRRQIECFDGGATEGVRALMLSGAPPEAGGYRQGAAAASSEVQLLIGGTREAALAGRLVALRRTGFRIAVLGLVGLGCASSGIIAAL